MMRIKNIYLGSLTSLAILASSMAHAEQMVTVPTLEGGVTASIGTWYAVPSADNTEYHVVTPDENSNHVLNNDGDYDFGWQATLGYVFDETANGIELSYRGLNNDNDETFSESTTTGATTNSGILKNNISYELNAFDLMLSQFIEIGDSMQMRFLGGLSYVELEQDFTNNSHVSRVNSDGTRTRDTHDKDHSEFTGWGPRVGIDARYDFGQGFGIVGGGSAAYYLGELEFTETFTCHSDGLQCGSNESIDDDHDNHAVTNLRANLGIDYVYYMDEDDFDYPTIGLELGYQVDYYANAIAQNPSDDVDSIAATFSGPYLNLKGAF
jgi:hypothetical protein